MTKKVNGLGQLINGKWQVNDKTITRKGEFKRENAKMRNWITPTGEKGPTGSSGFKAERGRYHLYVSLACPWAHRTLIFRKLKKLERVIGVSVVSPDLLEYGWNFNKKLGSTGDKLYNFDYLHKVYLKHNKKYTGKGPCCINSHEAVRCLA